MSLEKEVQAKAEKWLSSNIDAETRQAIEKLKQQGLMHLQKVVK